MYKVLLISIGLLMFTNLLQAQDTTALRAVSFSDTTEITITHREPLPLLFNSQILSKGLMKPPVDFGIQSYNAALFNPTFPLPTNNQFSSFDNKIMGAQRATQSIQINLQSGLKPNKAAITAGFMVNAFCLGGLIYQMAQPPKPNPNQPKGAPSR